MSERIDVAFALNGQERRLSVGRERRLLDVLREDLRLTGAKEGCGKGECGACTVLVNGQAVDSCLMMAWQADGAVVETIEGLALGGALDPLQDAFIAKGGVQCGICIPGMVMAGRALLDENPHPTYDEVREGLAGNLCRCTGYAKIFAAVAEAAGQATRGQGVQAPEGAAPSSLRPRSVAEALSLLEGGALRPLAGGTDLLVQAKDGHRDPAAFLDLTAVRELRGIEERGGELWIGAGTTHTELIESELVARWAPALPAACRVIGGPQIRNRGTVGGNLANASPAGDTLPPLYAMDGVVELASRSGARSVPISGFFTGPRQSALGQGELITGVRIPRREGVRGTFLRLGQRQAQAISKVSVAVSLTLRDGKVDWVRVAFGAVAPTVVRAPRAEALLLEGGVSAARRAAEAARDEVRPIDDLRSTREYRRQMAGVLLERAARSLLGPAQIG